jgi:hypothetical protein
MVDVQSAGPPLGRLRRPTADVAQPIVAQEMSLDSVGILAAPARGDPELLHRDYFGVLSAVPGGVLTPLLDVPSVVGAALRADLVSIALITGTVASAYPVGVRDAPCPCLCIDLARPCLVAALSSLTLAG